MKRIFLTSSLGGYTRTINGNEVVEKIVKCDNSNHFIDRLKLVVPKINTFVFVASNPDGAEKTDKYSSNIVKALNLDDFEIENLIVIDHRFAGDIAKTILSADVVFLAGGNVPKQNKYFKEIDLKAILAKYNGVVIGQSAGSMNCNKVVYAQPEENEEFEDVNFQRKLDGLGLVNFTIMPHMNFANNINELGYPSVMEMCLEDSYVIPHYGICDYGFIEVENNIATAYGKTLLIKDGQLLELCGDKESIQVSDDYTICDEMTK